VQSCVASGFSRTTAVYNQRCGTTIRFDPTATAYVARAWSIGKG
jgi:hypothetical protein